MAYFLSPASFRAAFRACSDCAEKQMATRYLREVANLGGRNPAREAELMGKLPMLLAYAEARTRRAA